MMNKKVLLTALMATFALTACKDEKTAQQLAEVQTLLAEVEKNHQQALATVAEKYKEVERLQALVKEAEEKANKTPEVIGLKASTLKLFEKSETLELPEDRQSSIYVSAGIVKTNLDWLNALLFNEFYQNSFFEDNSVKNSNVSEEDIKQRYQEIFDTLKQELQKEPAIGREEDQSVAYIGQRHNIAQFEMIRESYTGGAHGFDHTQYLVYDLMKKSRIKLNDVIPPNKQAILKEKLFEAYKYYSKENDLIRARKTDMTDFRVSDNFYFDNGVIVFSYPLYELAPYALGETKLELSYYTLEELLTPEFKKFLEEGYHLPRADSLISF